MREWALWGTRNLCEADDAIRKEIEVLAPEKILEAGRVDEARVESRVESGNWEAERVVSIEKSSKVEMETVSALEEVRWRRGRQKKFAAWKRKRVKMTGKK